MAPGPGMRTPRRFFRGPEVRECGNLEGREELLYFLTHLSRCLLDEVGGASTGPRRKKKGLSLRRRKEGQQQLPREEMRVTRSY